MSRSRQKTPIVGYTTQPSEKDFKRQENRRLRAAARSSDIEINPRKFRSSYGPKDGKHYIGDKHPDLLRK